MITAALAAELSKVVGRTLQPLELAHIDSAIQRHGFRRVAPPAEHKYECPNAACRWSGSAPIKIDRLNCCPNCDHTVTIIAECSNKTSPNAELKPQTP